jgi:hypothetical protein
MRGSKGLAGQGKPGESGRPLLLDDQIYTPMTPPFFPLNPAQHIDHVHVHAQDLRSTMSLLSRLTHIAHGIYAPPRKLCLRTSL